MFLLLHLSLYLTDSKFSIETMLTKFSQSYYTEVYIDPST